MMEFYCEKCRNSIKVYPQRGVPSGKFKVRFFDDEAGKYDVNVCGNCFGKIEAYAIKLELFIKKEDKNEPIK